METKNQKKDKLVVKKPPTNALAKREELPPSMLLQIAVEQGYDLVRLEKLMELQERWEKRQAEKEYLTAFAEFQKICPTIIRNKNRDDSKTSQTSKVKYNYADIEQIISQIKEPLSSLGLSYTFEDKMNGDRIEVTTIIRHTSGHSESTTLSAGVDTSGNKNNIQAHGSTISYLRRYGITGKLGIVTADDDTDTKEVLPLDKLSQELEAKIAACKSRHEVSAIWNANENLKKKNYFIAAIQAKGKEFPEIVSSISEELRHDIEIQDEKVGVDIIWRENPALHEDKEFIKLINDKTVKLINKKK